MIEADDTGLGLTLNVKVRKNVELTTLILSSDPVMSDESLRAIESVIPESVKNHLAPGDYVFKASMDEGIQVRLAPDSRDAATKDLKRAISRSLHELVSMLDSIIGQDPSDEVLVERLEEILYEILVYTVRADESAKIRPDYFKTTCSCISCAIPQAALKQLLSSAPREIRESAGRSGVFGDFEDVMKEIDGDAVLVLLPVFQCRNPFYDHFNDRLKLRAAAALLECQKRVVAKFCGTFFDTEITRLLADRERLKLMFGLTDDDLETASLAGKAALVSMGGPEN